MSNFSCEVAYPTITNGNPTNLDPTKAWTAATGLPPPADFVVWQSVSISGTGQYGLACSLQGSIYYSSDSGQTWTPTSTPGISGLNWYSVSISGTGQYGLACSLQGSIYYSSDSGQTWTISENTNLNSSLSCYWKQVSISSTGHGLACNYPFAGSPNSNIWYTSNNGISWNISPGSIGNKNWFSVSISDTGQYAIACSAIGYYPYAIYSGTIWYSTNYGIDWTQSDAISNQWVSVSISNSGRALAANGPGYIYYSNNNGINWVQSNSPSATPDVNFWQSVSISSTGQYGLACLAPGSIYYSSNYGVDWYQSENTSGLYWNSVSISDTGQYAISCYGVDTNINTGIDYISFETTPAYVNIETDLVYVFNEDKDGTNLIPYTTNINKNTTDLGTLFKNQYNTTTSLTTKYNTTIGIVNLNPTQPWSAASYLPSLPTQIWSSTPTWSSVSISSNGVNAIACTGTHNTGDDFSGSIYYSHDSGQTWIQSTPSPSTYPIHSVSISDTKYALACGYTVTYPSGTLVYGIFLRSENYGESWGSVTVVGAPAQGYSAWNCVSISSTGQYGIAGIGYINTGSYYLGALCYSNDYCNTWYVSPSTPNTYPFTGFNSVSISSTGQYALAANADYFGGTGLIFYSNDYGVTWEHSQSPTYCWYSVAISSTGQYGIASCSIPQGTSDAIINYYTSDYGVTWSPSSFTSSPSNPCSVSISSTGQYGLACINGISTYVYYTNDYGHTWTTSNSPINLWSNVTISSTGQHAIACYYNYYYDINQMQVTSSGIDYIEFSTTPTVVDLSTILQPTNPAYWSIVPSTSGQQEWWSVSISGTGQYGIAGCRASIQITTTIYYSSDYGNTWNPSLGTSGLNFYAAVSISNTGQYGLALDGIYGIIYSYDYGASWTKVKGYSSQYFEWISISISGNGQYGIACSDGSNIYYSTDCGSDNKWFISNGSPSSAYWWSVSNSSTGQYALACASLVGIADIVGIYYSSNYGQDWNLADNTTSQAWKSVSISSTGQYGLACASVGSIYYSSDFGHTWSPAANTSGQGWWSVSISRTGQYGLASINYNPSPGYSYYSSDFGHTWTASSDQIGETCNSVSISDTGQYGLKATTGNVSGTALGSIYRLNG